MLHTLGEAYKVAMLGGRTPGAHELFHLATRGNAVNLGLDDEIGSLEPGRWADVIVLDPTATPVLEARHALSESLEDTLFALAILGDDRAVRTTYIAGRKIWGRVTSATVSHRRTSAMRSGSRATRIPAGWRVRESRTPDVTSSRSPVAGT